MLSEDFNEGNLLPFKKNKILLKPDHANFIGKNLNWNFVTHLFRNH